MRPPSSGAPGSRLNTPSTTLTKPSQPSTVTTVSGGVEAHADERGAVGDETDDDAGERSGSGDPALRLGGLRFLIEPGDAPERPQVDRRRGHTEPARTRMGQLMAEDRGEEGDDADGRRYRTEIVRQAEGEERRHQSRAPVDSQRGAGEAPEGHRSGEHGGLSTITPAVAAASVRLTSVAARAQLARSSTTVAQLRPLAPDPRAGERRRAGEVEPGHGGLVAGQLGMAMAGRPAGHRRSWRRGRRGRWKSRS